MQESVNSKWQGQTDVEQWKSLYDAIAGIPFWKLPPITRERFPEKKIYPSTQSTIGELANSLYAGVVEPKGWSVRLCKDAFLQPVTLSRIPDRDITLSITFHDLDESIYKSQFASWLEAEVRSVEIHNILEGTHEIFTIENIVEIAVDPYFYLKLNSYLRVSFSTPANNFSYELKENEVDEDEVD